MLGDLLPPGDLLPGYQITTGDLVPPSLCCVECLATFETKRNAVCISRSQHVFINVCICVYVCMYVYMYVDSEAGSGCVLLSLFLF